jgi:folate-dependent phosphoribosylglycinamide formyltransferase PurN
MKMMAENTAVIAVRISKELKEELKKYQIDQKEVIRQALVDAVKRAKARDLENRVKDIEEILDKLSAEDAVKYIREDREKR